MRPVSSASLASPHGNMAVTFQSAVQSKAQPAPAGPIEITGSTYAVKAGDSLARIAHGDPATMGAIALFNGLASPALKPGQALTIYNPALFTPEQRGYFAAYAKAMSAGDAGALAKLRRSGIPNAESLRLRPPEAPRVPRPRTWDPSSPAPALSPSQGEPASTHVVKRGESLWTLSHGDPTRLGATAALNGLSNSTLQPGRVLKLYDIKEFNDVQISYFSQYGEAVIHHDNATLDRLRKAGTPFGPQGPAALPLPAPPGPYGDPDTPADSARRAPAAKEASPAAAKEDDVNLTVPGTTRLANMFGADVVVVGASTGPAMAGLTGVSRYAGVGGHFLLLNDTSSTYFRSFPAGGAKTLWGGVKRAASGVFTVDVGHLTGSTSEGMGYAWALPTGKLKALPDTMAFANVRLIQPQGPLDQFKLPYYAGLVSLGWAVNVNDLAAMGLEGAGRAVRLIPLPQTQAASRAMLAGGAGVTAAKQIANGWVGVGYGVNAHIDKQTGAVTLFDPAGRQILDVNAFLADRLGAALASPDDGDADFGVPDYFSP